MNDFFNKTEYTQADIDQLIANKIEESSHLDYKEAGALARTEGKKKDISKDVSAFANSDGGIIIYGIEEKDHVPTNVSFIDGNEFTKEWLEQVIQSTINKKIEGLQIIPIRYNDEITNSVYIVKIPNDLAIPHMAIDNRYYRRYDFNSVPLEEYEVKNRYFIKEKTQLKLALPEANSSPNGFSGDKLMGLNLVMTFHIDNIGSTIERDYKLEIAIPQRVLAFGTPTYNPFGQYYLRHEVGYIIYSIPNKSPLFQNERGSFGQYSLIIKYQSLIEAQNNPIRLKLYYTGGIEESEFDLNPYLTWNNKPLTIENFKTN